MSAGQGSTSPILKARIEAYTGIQPLVIFSDMIRQSVAKVVELIPREQLYPYLTFMGGIGSGASIVNKKVFVVGNGAREVTETQSYRYMDPTSIYYITNSRDQIYWQTDKMVFSFPEDADCEVIDYSAVAETDTEISCLPPQYTEAVVLDVAMQVLSAQLALLSGEQFSLNITLARDPNVVSLVYPSAIGDLTLVWNEVQSITDLFQSDVGTVLEPVLAELAALKAAVDTDLGSESEDIELGLAHLSDAKNLLDEYMQRSDLLFKKILANSEIEKMNRIKAYEKSVEDAHNKIAQASHDLEAFTSHGQLLIAERKEKNDQVLAFTQTMQILGARFASFFAPFHERKET